jgi:hypothetical protein
LQANFFALGRGQGYETFFGLVVTLLAMLVAFLLMALVRAVLMTGFTGFRRLLSSRVPTACHEE